jgi:peroxiredoxin
MLETGRPAPEFSLKDLAGTRHSLRENLKKGPVLVVFFKISCPTCQLILPFLERLAPAVNIIGISQDDCSSTKEFIDYFHVTFPVLIDPAKDHFAVSSFYHLTNVPSMFLIEPDGKVSCTLDGFHKGDLESLASRFGRVLFLETDRVPLMKPG